MEEAWHMLWEWVVSFFIIAAITIYNLYIVDEEEPDYDTDYGD